MRCNICGKICEVPGHINVSKPREWFAVKITKESKYQFYPPNENNLAIIEDIAPDRGNFEVIRLIEYSAYEDVCKQFEDADYGLQAVELAKQRDELLAQSDRWKEKYYDKCEDLQSSDEMLEKLVLVLKKIRQQACCNVCKCSACDAKEALEEYINMGRLNDKT